MDDDVPIAHEAALESLVPTMGIVEAEGGSNDALRDALKRYLNFSFNQAPGSPNKSPEWLQDDDSDTSYTAEGLIQQEERTAGVLLLAVVTSVALVFLFALRWRFSPTSLGELAWQYLEGVQSRREWLAMHPQRSRNIQEHRVPHDMKNDGTFGNEFETSNRTSLQSYSHAQGDSSLSSIGIDPTIRRSMSVYVSPPTDI